MTTTSVRPVCPLCPSPLLFEGTDLAGCEGGHGAAAVREALGWEASTPVDNGRSAVAPGEPEPQERDEKGRVTGDNTDGAERLDPDDFFQTGLNGRETFVPARLAGHLRNERPVAAGGEALHVYIDGAYRPDGEALMRHRMAELLQEKWRKAYAEEAVAHLRDTAPPLLERPPLDVVNCANGLLDLGTGDLEPHDPALLTPTQIAVAHDPAATCPAIEAFIDGVLAEDVRPVFWELAGYLLVPDNRMQRAFMFLGGGANGKSTALSVLAELLGRENVSAVPLHKLDEDRFATAQLYGRLANVFADLDARALAASSMFKSITGGDAIEAERKFRPAFTFRPYARLLFSANEPPPTSDSSEAFFRRWTVIPFERSFPEAERDANLLARLTTPAELSGLLNRALEHLPALRERGYFSTSDTINRAGERFRVAVSSPAGFLDEECSFDRDARVPKPELYSSYKNWCQESNLRPLSARRFHAQVKDLVPDHGEQKSSGIDYVLGLRLGGDG